MHVQNSDAAPPQEGSSIYAEFVGDAVAQTAEVSLLPLNYKAISLCARLFNLS